jgi:hypothetical protein
MPRANIRLGRCAPTYIEAMWIRRAFYVWQFVAAAVLPVWVLLGYAISGTSIAGLLGVVLVAPLVLAVELGLALLFSARATVRQARALDAPAIAVLAAFQVGVLGFGVFGAVSAWFGLLAAAAAIGGFWLGGRLLMNDVRARMQAAFGPFNPAGPTIPTGRAPIDAGEFVVIKPAP